MSTIINKRVTARREGDFVVFLIGMRANKWWKFGKIASVASAMGRMIKELESKPDSGFLGYEQWFGRTTIMVQYWESFEKLELYANDRTGEHYPAWIDYYKKIKASDAAIGIWHETYKIAAQNYECVYANMPAFGLGKVSNLKPAEGNSQTAKQRIEEIK